MYPSGKPRGFEPLAYLAGFFDCIEMNVSFYRVPTAELVVKWLKTVEDRPDFRFTYKLYRGLTHDTEDEALPPYLDALEPCRAAGRLGAILLQFPYFFRNTKQSRARLSKLAGGLEGWPCAVEIRDQSWLIKPALDFIGRLSFSLVNIDICQAKNSVPPGSTTTGPIGYVRLHGRNHDAWFDRDAHRDQKYDYLYTEAELEEWVRHVNVIAARTDSTYVITNNHFGGKAVANAFMLARRVTDHAPTPPKHIQQEFAELA